MVTCHGGEIAGLEEAGTFGDASQQQGGNVVSAKWVNTWKSDENGTVVKAKARLVARGFSQRPVVDYHDTFAPTPTTPWYPLDGCDSM